MKKLKEFFHRYKAVSVTALTLFAVCSVVVITTLVKTYAAADGTVYLSEVIDPAGSHDFSDRVHLFKADYDGTVVSADGAKVIAPGTRNAYKLDISNNTEEDLYYGFKVYAEVKNSPERNGEPLKLPVELTVTGPDKDQTLVGLDGESGHKYLNGYSIRKGRVQSFAFTWKWDYETGDDEADTLWGNASAGADPGKEPELDVYIQIYMGKDTYAYTLTFDPAGGTLIGKDHKLAFRGAPYGEMPGAAKDGYSFLGWFTASGELVREDDIVTTDSDFTLYARYERNFDDYFEVRFDAGEGALEDPSEERRTVKDGAPYGDLPRAKAAGKNHTGWNTKPDGTGEQITPETLVDLDRDITLYATYESTEDSFIVTFDAGLYGDVIGAGTKTVTNGETYGLLPYAEAPGRIFIGWYTGKNGTGEMITQDTLVTLSGDVTLYAYYGADAGTHTVTFDAGEYGMVKGGPSPKKVTEGMPYGQMPSAEKAGYIFTGWYSGTGEKVTPQTIVGGSADETLYAGYERKSGTGVVTFDPGEGGTVNVYAQKEIVPDSTYGKLPKAIKEGKTFIGWYTEPEGKGVLITPESSTGKAEDITLYAYYGDAEHTCVITFDAGEGILIGRKRKIVRNGEPYGELSRGELEGKYFLGWYTRKEGRGTKITSEMLVSLDTDITLYAYYGDRKDTVILTFDPGEGGEVIGEAVKYVKTGTRYGILPWARKEGYSFIGWYTEPGGKGTRVSSGTWAEMDATLYAYYERNVEYHTVTFDPCEGHLIGPEQKTVVNGMPYGQLPQAVTYDERSFIGWYTEPEGKGERIYAEKIVDLDHDITVYAFYRWDPPVSEHTSDFNGVKRYSYPRKGAQESKGEWELVDVEEMNWVFRGKNGYATSGWFYIKNPYSSGGIPTIQWFHFNADGLMDKGWILVGARDWYHLREIPDGDLGSLDHGWYHDSQDEKTYYLDPETGLMWYGWQKIGGTWYYFATEKDISGRNWILDDGDRYGGVAKWVYDTTQRSYGSMYAEEMTPDGHYVGADGSWDGEGKEPTATQMTPPEETNMVNGYPEELAGYTYELLPRVGTSYTEIRKQLSGEDQTDPPAYRRVR